MAICVHTNVSCVNPYQLVRKYQCRSCGGIMTCKCEEEFARRYLPHQISKAATHGFERIPVTLNFVNAVCNTCRGEPEPACPKAERPGRMSKVKRYYWREIQFRAIPRFAAWAEANGDPDWLSASRRNRDAYELFEREVIEEIKQLHSVSPKYVYSEEPQSAVLAHCGVETVNLRPRRIRQAGSIVFEIDFGCVGSPIEVAQHHFGRFGYASIFTESRPFHVIFGALMWPEVQDAADPKALRVARGRRGDSSPQVGQGPVWTLHPADFGTAEYGCRRSEAIGRHLSTLRLVKGGLSRLFDRWMEPSSALRTYLCGNRPEDAAAARRLLSILPADRIIAILDYLSRAYWQRYCGWPDLLFYRGSEFFFAEVKFSGDGLREEQKAWIRGNASELHLPFKLIKVHKTPLE